MNEIAWISLVAAAAVIGWSLAGARLRSRLSASDVEVRELRIALDYQQRAAAERASDLEQLKSAFANASAEALDQNSRRFLDLAQAQMREDQVRAVGELDLRKQAVEHLVADMAKSLSHVDAKITDLDRQSRSTHGSLTEQVRAMHQTSEALRDETKSLVNAMRSPNARGLWGEMQLRRVVEFAGMVEHCDFDERTALESGDGRVVPDLVVHLPGNGRIAVDSKVPLQAYLDADAATDPAVSRTKLTEHARQLRSHVDALAKKEYWVAVGSPDYVVLFVPGDVFLNAALDHEPNLYEYALRKNVLFATPTSLIALLRTCAHGWQQEKLAVNAREIQGLGQQLYKSVGDLAKPFAKLGRAIGSAMAEYNNTLSSVEGNLLLRARKFRELGVPGDDLPEISPLDEAQVKTLRAPELDFDDTPSVIRLPDAANS